MKFGFLFSVITAFKVKVIEIQQTSFFFCLTENEISRNKSKNQKAKHKRNELNGTDDRLAEFIECSCLHQIEHAKSIEKTELETTPLALGLNTQLINTFKG